MVDMDCAAPALHGEGSGRCSAAVVLKAHLPQKSSSVMFAESAWKTCCPCSDGVCARLQGSA